MSLLFNPDGVLPFTPEALPDDLREALDAESALYRSAYVTPDAAAHGGGLSLVAPDLLRIRPAEASAPAWIGGRLTAFGDAAAPAFSGEVVHVDPRTGDLIACSGRKEIEDLDALRRARWIFSPFDFADALVQAAWTWAPQPARLSEALRSASGDPPRATPKADFWDRPWTILWGPPGTGKTQLLAERLAALIRRRPEVRVLAVAPTNRSADVLAARVAEEVGEPWMGSLDTCPVFRGGVGVGVELVERFPDVVREPELREVLRRIAEHERKLTSLASAGGQARQQAELRRRISELRRSIPDPTLQVVRRDRTRLVVTTLHRALRLASELQGQRPFSHLVIDEAGMVARAAAALVAPLAPRVALAGDPRQLSPISQAAEGEGRGVRHWLRRSPLSHLDQPGRARAGVDLLRVQHRMHPDVGDVVSRFSYAGVLEHGPGTRKPRPGRPRGFPDARAVRGALPGARRGGEREIVRARAVGGAAPGGPPGPPGTGHVLQPGLASMLERLLRLAADRRASAAADALLRRATVMHADEAAKQPEESFDAVFVDEAQDFDAALLARVYALARYGAPTEAGAARRLKPFLLFADDSQNVYGNRPLEELAEALPDRLSFTGRVRVLREAFRSTREVLDLAFNVVLDPKKRHTVANPGMREALHVRELAELGLLLEPERVLEGLFRVAYTERRGRSPGGPRFPGGRSGGAVDRRRGAPADGG